MKQLLFLLSLLGWFLPALAQHQILQERRYLLKPYQTDILASSQDKFGNVYYSGTSWTAVSKWDNYFLKVKPNTDTLWTRKNPIKLDYTFLSIQALNNGDIVTGANYGVQQMGITMKKISSIGTTIFSKNFTSTPSMVNSILALPGKDILLGGGYGPKLFAFTRTDSLGNVKWSKGYAWNSYTDALMDMKFNKSAQIIAAGITDNPVGPVHIKLMLLNQNGDSLLGRQLVLTDSNRTESMFYNYSSVTPISTGGYLITGGVDTITVAQPGGSYMAMVVKVDANLNYQWKYIHRTVTTEEYHFTKAKELVDGKVIVLGFKSRPLTTGNINGFQIYRFSPQGQLLNVYPFTSSNCTQVLGITLDALPDSTFMIGGRCGNFNPDNYGFYVAKVKIPGLPLPLPTVNISGVQEELITSTGLGQSYPNPTNSEATIPYQLPGNYQQASINIREIATGRELRKYELQRSESSLKVDLNNFSNGLYVYSLEVDGKQMATKKLAVIK